jgi:hypothetical protein
MPVVDYYCSLNKVVEVRDPVLWGGDAGLYLTSLVLLHTTSPGRRSRYQGCRVLQGESSSQQGTIRQGTVDGRTPV